MTLFGLFFYKAIRGLPYAYELIDKLSDLLEAELVLIPWDKYEEYGHADGMVRYMGEGRVLVNNYCDFDKSLRKKLIQALTPHFDILELHYGCYHTRNSWSYLNFLHIGTRIFVPMLSEKLDDTAMIQISEAYTLCQCYAINEWQHVVKHGGALNCTTWSIQIPRECCEVMQNPIRERV